MTKSEAVTKLGQIVAQRLGKEGVPTWRTATNVMGTLNDAAGAEVGFCRYLVNGQEACVGGITEAECTQQLQGDFSQTPCGQS